jgi:hypothetical protein
MENTDNSINTSCPTEVSNDTFYFFDEVPDLYCVYHPIQCRNVFVVKGVCFDMRDQAAYDWLNYIRQPMPISNTTKQTHKVTPAKARYTVSKAVTKEVKFQSTPGTNYSATAARKLAVNTQQSAQAQTMSFTNSSTSSVSFNGDLTNSQVGQGSLAAFTKPQATKPQIRNPYVKSHQLLLWDPNIGFSDSCESDTIVDEHSNVSPLTLAVGIQNNSSEQTSGF